MRNPAILLTAARSPLSVDLAHSFYRMGGDVLTGDYTVNLCQYSNAVAECLPLVSPRFHTNQFIEQINTALQKRKVDLVIPLYEEAMYLSWNREKLVSPDHVFVAPFELLHQLHNKWLFQVLVDQVGMYAIPSNIIRRKSDLAQLTPGKAYALKPCYSRTSLHVQRYRVGEPVDSLAIEPWNPWIAQEWIEGANYCTYSVCHHGRVTAHSCYPVDFAIHGHSCLNFTACDHPGIQAWVQEFVEATGYHGQIGFDFVEREGRLYAFDCNPRATSGLHLLTSHPRIADAFLDSETPLVTPEVGLERQITLGMVIYAGKMPKVRQCFLEYLWKLFTTRDVVFDSRDWKPWMMQPIVLGAMAIRAWKLGLPIPAAVVDDFNWDNRA